MNKRIILPIAAGVAIAFGMLTSCNKQEMTPNGVPEFYIDGINYDNYPNVDCSESELPLQEEVASIIFGSINTASFDKITRCSGTEGAIRNLIDGKADLILISRNLTSDERAYASAKGVKLTQIGIAHDALIFLANPNNHLSDFALSSNQIQRIFNGKISNWSEVGGDNLAIRCYNRDEGSDSRAYMENEMMGGARPVSQGLPSIDEDSKQPFAPLAEDCGSMTYSSYSYYMNHNEGSVLGIVNVNGWFLTYQDIESGEYPYTTDVYLLIRSDMDGNSNAHKLYMLMSDYNIRKDIMRGAIIKCNLAPSR
jgi:ABC-type phosphate transport system, periplasmic component